MVDEQPITELLKKAKSGDREATDKIIQHLWTAARLEAEKNLAAGVRRFKRGSDVANDALRSALSNLAKPLSSFSSREKFEHFVLKIVKRKAKSVGRGERAQKRDESRRRITTGDMADIIAKKNEPTAPELAICAELGKRITAILEEEPDSERKSIALMGIIQHLSPGIIQRELISSGAPARAIRTIQKTIQEAKERLAGVLREEYGNLLPPRKASKKAPKKSDKHGSKKSGTTGRKKAGKKTTKKGGEGHSAKGRKGRP